MSRLKVEEFLPSKHKALSSISAPQKKDLIVNQYSDFTKHSKNVF
jgi:hypothetical protein